MIEATRLGARSGNFALRDVSFRVGRGDYAMVTGPAGAGKTTLLEVIAGTISLTEGTLWIDGAETKGVPPEQRRVGFVYQHSYLFPHLSVRENVGYGARDPQVGDDLAERLGITALYGRPVRSLSGGERQLVALSRALAVQPRVLLLDEPYGALDAPRREQTMQVVQQLYQAWEMTVLHVTHSLEDMAVPGSRIQLDGGTLKQ